MKKPKKRRRKFDDSSIRKHWDERKKMRKEHFSKKVARQKGQKKLKL